MVAMDRDASRVPLFRSVEGRSPFPPSPGGIPSMTRLSRCAMVVAAAAALGAARAAAQAPAAPQVTVGGLVYAQYLYQDFPTAGVRQNNFSIQRAYINVIGRFAGGIYTRVTADVYTPPAVTTDNSRTFRLKYAYFGYTPTGSSLTFKLGAIHTPWLDWEETLWDYRVQGQMAMERGGYLTSSDFGAGIDYKQGPDKINGQFTIVNGEGYSGGSGDFRKDAEVRLSARVMDTDDSSRVGGLRLTGYGQFGKATGGADRDRYIGMVSYRSKQITLAGEFGATKDVAVKGRVISAFGVYKLTNSKNAG